jgi:hypothetical protein
VLTFNLFLTGYDVQSINLYDVIRRGRIAPDDGTGWDVSNVGELSGDYINDETFDNPLLDERSCIDVPVIMPPVYAARMQSAFTTGKAPAADTHGACNTAGGVHRNATGYATIDVVGNCGQRSPQDPRYFSDDIRFDNVLVGDYVQFARKDRMAQGSAMVHVRAIPEGGSPRDRAVDPSYEVQFPRTFYDAFLAHAPHLDARQPLPSVFAARWADGGATDFETRLKIWREPRETGIPCARYPAANGDVKFIEMVRFDEEENPETHASECVALCIDNSPRLPATSLIRVSNEAYFPPNTEDAPAGWMYLNLDDTTSPVVKTSLQSWVVTSMQADDVFSVDMDAHALGNGCSDQVYASEASDSSGVPIGPLPNKRRSQR